MNWPKYLIEYGDTAAILILMTSLACAIGIVLRGFQSQHLRRNLASVFGIAVCCLFLFASLQYLRIAPKKIQPLKPVFQAEGQPAPDLVYTSLDSNTTHHLSELAGKVVVLNIWATWCAACKGEMPDLDRLQQMYRGRGVVVLTITDEDAATVSRYKAIADLTVLKGHVAETSTSGLYIRPDIARPVTHIIDAHGILRQTLIGRQSLQQFQTEIAPYLASADSPRL